jgi:hypothetical protein
LQLTPEQFWELTPYEFMLLYEGYQARKKDQEYLVAWQTALLLNAWRGDEKAHIIEVADLLPWVAKAQKKILHEKARGAPIKQAESIKPAEKPKPAESAVDKAVKKYALLKGINLDELTPEELADLTADAINNEAGGIFGKAPTGWRFPTEPTTEVVK